MTVCPFAECFGTTFRRLRKQAKLSQQDVATRGGFDRSYVTLIELGKKNPTMSVIEKMASVVSPTVYHFFDELVSDARKEGRRRKEASGKEKSNDAAAATDSPDVTPAPLSAGTEEQSS